MKTRSVSSSIVLFGASLLALGACASGKPTHVPLSYFEGTTLDRNAVTATATTEYLEVNLNPADSQLRLTEIRKLKSFLADYHQRGHGPLIMSVPESAANPQLAIEAVVEARQMAWEAGIEYSQIAGSAYNASERANAPLIVAFKAYDAVAPDCPSLGEVDFSNAVSNSDLPTLGCSVRSNLAAMIADPADLYGQRALDEGDIGRREKHYELWRAGAATAAERADSESGAISSAVN